MDLVRDLTLVILAGLAGGVVARLVKQPLLVGYIVAGVIVGPFTGGATVENLHDIEALAEVGVALLLFSLGLELSFADLLPVKRVALAGTTIQVLLTIGLGVTLGPAMGWSWNESVWAGALASPSSTLVVLKTLQAQGRIGTLSSRVMIGITIAQDLAVVPLMIVLPELAGGTVNLPGLGIAVVKAAFFMAVVVIVGARATRWLFGRVAGWQSRELFLLTATAVALGIGYLSSLFGLSLAIGAFVGGLVVSESDYAHQALSDVIPLRDLFGMVFFVSVGMLLDPAQMWRDRGAILVLVAAVTLGKALILAGVVRAFGYRRIVPIAVGLTLFQFSEFAFVLARVGVREGAITEGLSAVVLNSALVTMVLTPLVSGLSPVLYRWLRSSVEDEGFQVLNLPDSGLSDHVIIAGAGRVGRTVAGALARLGLPFVLMELDERRAQDARAASLPVIYGDSAQLPVLHAAGLAAARALLVTIPFTPDVRAIVRTARQERADIPIIVRAEGPEAVADLYQLEVDEVVSPEVEAGIEMTRSALLHLDLPPQEILHVAAAMRHERGRADPAEARTERAFHDELGQVARHLEFRWLLLPPHSPMAGRTLVELRVRSVTGAVVVAVFHRGRLNANPHADYRLEEGDLVALIGRREQVAAFEEAAAAS